MSDIATVNPNLSPLNTQADKLLRNSASAEAENSKIDKSARDFEALLLGSWLQQAEQSFATVPGGDDDDDADAGKEQMMGIAMQAMGTAMAANGGIGIAKMIAKHLHKAQDAVPPEK
jgi:Rod binding domain-containing protein